MPAKSKSVFRQPGVQHFQLVHRSQRDPLISDPSASKHVLKAFERENVVKKGKSRADLESILGDELQSDRENVGEASLYGIYYDDTDYDYMQHLRPVGASEEGVDSVLLEAPTLSKSKGKRKAGDLELRLPEEALPSANQRSQLEAQDSLLGVPSALAGLNPDMDPHLRQTLEALEDDAFVMDEDEGEVEEDWLGELLDSGELKEGEQLEFEFEEWGIGDDEDIAGSQLREELEKREDEEDEADEAEIDDIRARLAAFKLAQNRLLPSPGGSDAASADEQEDEEDEFQSEAADTLPPLTVIGAKRRHKGTRSDSTGFSLSSSSIYRSEGQRLTDDRFDVVERAYEEEDEEGLSDDESSNDEAPDLLSRDDFESIVDGFLEKYEQVGHTVRPASEKLDTIRRALEPSFRTFEDKDDDNILMPVDIDEEKERWDCETILSTYSNLENHPRVISARLDSHPVRRIRLDQRTGLPSVAEDGRRKREERDDRGDRHRKVQPVTIARPKEESKEEKKARKVQVKQERQVRRSEKKATQTAFSAERKAQLKGPPALTIKTIKL